MSHNLPPHLARLKALEAAEKRRKVSQILGGEGGRRLGGGHLGGNLTPSQKAAQVSLLFI